LSSLRERTSFNKKDEASKPGKHDKQKLPLTVSRPELLVKGSDSLYRQLVHNLFSFLSTHEAIRDGLASSIGLGGIQHTILLSIRHLGRTGEVNVRDIADHLKLSGSFITAETAKMERSKLLTKKRSETDGRKVSLELTPKAIGLFDAVAPLQRAIGDVEFGCLTGKQFRDLAAMVANLVHTSQESLLLLEYLKSNDAHLRGLGSSAFQGDETEV
jgi:DNA-binding MarR family transcriptional regulator